MFHFRGINYTNQDLPLPGPSFNISENQYNELMQIIDQNIYGNINNSDNEDDQESDFIDNDNESNHSNLIQDENNPENEIENDSQNENNSAINEIILLQDWLLNNSEEDNQINELTPPKDNPCKKSFDPDWFMNLNSPEKSYYFKAITEFHTQFRGHDSNASFEKRMLAHKQSMLMNEKDEKTKKIIQKLPKSYYTIAKNIKLSIVERFKYYYCPCGIIGPIAQDELNSNIEFKCQSGHIFNPKYHTNDCYFIHSCLRDNFERILPLVYKDLRFPSQNINDDDTLNDIINGDAYRSLVEGRSEDGIVIYIGWDGVTVNKNTSVWPLLVYICELPEALREAFSMLISVHIGSVKELANKQIEPFIEDLLKLCEKPLKFKVNENGRIVEKTLTVSLLFAVCDGPARAKLLAIMGHSSKLGCNVCLTDTLKKFEALKIDEIRYRDDTTWRKLAEEVVNKKIDPTHRSISANYQGIKGNKLIFLLKLSKTVSDDLIFEHSYHNFLKYPKQYKK